MLTKLGGVRDVDFPAFDDDQAEFGQFVQDARKVFLRQVEAGGDDALVGRQRDGDINAVLLTFRQLAQEVADDALFPGVELIRLDVVNYLLQAHGHAGQHFASGRRH